MDTCTILQLIVGVDSQATPFSLFFDGGGKKSTGVSLSYSLCISGMLLGTCKVCNLF